MKRREFLVGLATAAPLALSGSAVFAATFAEDLIAQLTKMGFLEFEVETTWLGRVVIIATRGDGVREIVLNPRTGEILRDVWRPTSGAGATRVVLDDIAEEAEHEAGDDGDEGNSGSGSDSSGSGDHSGPGGGGDDEPQDPEDPEDPEEPEDPKDPEDK